MLETIKLRVKKSSSLNILTIVLNFYAIFLFFLGLIIKSNETVIETCIMMVVAIIFDFINDGEVVISEEGFKYEKFGFVKWSEIEFFNIRKNIIEIKIKNQKRYRIEINIREDIKNIENANKFVNSKVKTIDFDKENYEAGMSKGKRY
jgi:hypothetical protein